MIRKALVAAVTLIVVGLLSTACTSTEAPTPTPKPAQSTSAKVTDPTPPPSEPQASAPLTDSELAVLQLDKFAYMQDSERIEMFEESGYHEAKIKIATDALSGAFGTPKVEEVPIFDDLVYAVEIGTFNDPSQLYIWFYVYPNEVSGELDPATVRGFDLQVPGQQFVRITDTVHDWPTTVDGKSVDLQYGVGVGVNNYDLSAITCIWSEIEQERDFCQGNEAQTKTVSDMVLLDELAIQTMQQSIDALYGSSLTA